jgi:hypothetical protein
MKPFKCANRINFDLTKGMPKEICADLRNRKNHKGNYQISVSFDVFGECSNRVADSYIADLDKTMRTAFAKWKARYNAVTLKSVRWNE